MNAPLAQSHPPLADDAATAAAPGSAAATASDAPTAAPDSPTTGDGPRPVRRKPRPGERRDQILQALAVLLEAPDCDRITTATLARQLGGSEAALYRHFSNKAQMFEGLIDFVEEAVFSLVQQIVGRDMMIAEHAPDDGALRAARIVEVVLKFAERNPGLVRVMMGDILLLENEALVARMGRFFDRIEATLRQCLRPAAGALGSATPVVDAQVAASVLMSFVQGRLHRFVRTGFRRAPTEHLAQSLSILL